MTNLATRVSTALRRKYPGPNGRKRVAAILGIDENLINAVPESAGNGNEDRLTKVRAEMEALLQDGATGNRLHPDLRNEINTILDQICPWPSNVYRDSDRDLAGDNGVEKLRQFLKPHLSSDDIETAVKLIGGMPANALEGGMHGALSRKTVERAKTQVAQDAKLARRFPGIENIMIEAPPLAVDAKPLKLGPSRAAVERFNKKYPDAARIC